MTCTKAVKPTLFDRTRNQYRAHMAFRQFSGMQLVPPALVGAVRNALKAQGYDPDAISDSGEIAPSGFFTSAFDTMEIRSALWDGPLVLNLRGPSNPLTRAMIDQIQPDVLLRGPAGQYRYSPAGTPSGSPFLPLMLGGVAIAAGVGLTYYALKR